eukprot:362782-Chlamydomonas_euryale.AAC.4
MLNTFELNEDPGIDVVPGDLYADGNNVAHWCCPMPLLQFVAGVYARNAVARVSGFSNKWALYNWHCAGLLVKGGSSVNTACLNVDTLKSVACGCIGCDCCHQTPTQHVRTRRPKHRHRMARSGCVAHTHTPPIASASNA